MSRPISGFQKLKFYLSVSALYALTLVFVLTTFSSKILLKEPVMVYATPLKPVSIERKVISGKPLRLILPSLQIDLPIEDGIYDSANDTWSISDYRAHFALPSVLPNDLQGNTIIYGHNNNTVFGKLKGLIAGNNIKIMTDNGYTINYVYTEFADLKPNDLSIFKNDGPSTLLVQTCSGSWNELRRMYYFKFDKVII